MWLTELKAAANCKDSKNAIFGKIILLRVFEDCTITDVLSKHQPTARIAKILYLVRLYYSYIFILFRVFEDCTVTNVFVEAR